MCRTKGPVEDGELHNPIQGILKKTAAKTMHYTFLETHQPETSVI